MWDLEPIEGYHRSCSPSHVMASPSSVVSSQVYTGTRLTHGVLGFCVVVVSARFPPTHVEGRIEAFLESFAAK